MENKIIRKQVLAKGSKCAFAIEKQIANNGDANYIPLCGQKFKFFKPNFTRIVKVYDTYHILDLAIPEHLTEAEAMQHIQGYITQLNQQHQNDLKLIEVTEVTLP